MDERLLDAWSGLLGLNISMLKAYRRELYKILKASGYILITEKAQVNFRSIYSDYLLWLLRLKNRGGSIKSPRLKLRIIDYLRERTRSRRKGTTPSLYENEDPLEFIEGDNGDEAIQRVLSKELVEAMDRELSRTGIGKHRRALGIFIDHAVHDYTFVEIADNLGISESRACQIYHEVRDELEERLSGTTFDTLYERTHKA